MLLMLLLVAQEVHGQEQQEIHPWFTECDRYGCFPDYFCNFEVNNSVCELCPSTPAEECAPLLGLSNNLGVEDCLSECGRGQEGEPCSEKNQCEEKSLFCNFQNGDSGTCEKCKTDLSECLLEDYVDIISDRGRQDCLESCDLKCVPMHFSSNFVDGAKITSTALVGSPSTSVSGPVVDCTNLIYDGQPTCPDANNSVCLVEDYTKNTYYVDVVNKCANSGGVAVVFLDNMKMGKVPMNHSVDFSVTSKRKFLRYPFLTMMGYICNKARLVLTRISPCLVQGIIALKNKLALRRFPVLEKMLGNSATSSGEEMRENA